MKRIIIIAIGIILIVLMVILNGTNNKKVEDVEKMKVNEDIFANKEVKVDISSAKEIIAKDKDLLILDTRTQDEYDAGHIEGAILIPYNELERRIDEIDGFEDKPILVYCRTGNRSAVAVQILIDNGFNKIYHMNQGYSKWK